MAIEAVGIPETFELCTDLVRPGGHVANVGVHGEPATLHLERCGSGTSRSPPDWSTPGRRRSSRGSSAGRLDVSRMITHRFGIDEMQDAYDVFSRAGETGALKVALFSPEASS